MSQEELQENSILLKDYLGPAAGPNPVISYSYVDNEHCYFKILESPEKKDYKLLKFQGCPWPTIESTFNDLKAQVVVTDTKSLQSSIYEMIYLRNE